MAQTKTKPKGAATLSAKEIALQKKNAELQNKLEKLEADAEKSKALVSAQLPEAPEVKEQPAAKDPALISRDQLLLAEMQAQIKLLSDQVLTQQTLVGPGKPRYLPVPEDDFQDIGITFSARQVYLVIGSYLNSKSMEVMPPYKLIKFQYAASDIRKDGREETVVNSCTFTSHLKAEIKYLRNHPHFNVVFFENLNKTMSVDSLYQEFRVKAAQQVVAMTDEAVLSNAHQMLTGVDRVPVKDLRAMLVAKLGDQYVQDAKELDNDLARRRLLGE